MLLRDQDRIDIGPYRLIFHQPKAPRLEHGDETTFEKTVIHFKPDKYDTHGPPPPP